MTNVAQDEWTDVSAGTAVDLRKHEGVPFIGTLVGFDEVDGKFGKKNRIWNFVDANKAPFSIYGMSFLDSILGKLVPGVVCRITYTGKQNKKTKYGMKDCNTVSVQVKKDEVPF